MMRIASTELNSETLLAQRWSTSIRSYSYSGLKNQSGHRWFVTI